MMPNCSQYTRRLLRMKTLGPSFELARAATQNSNLSDLKSGSATGQQSTSLSGKDKIHCQRTSSSKYDSNELWMSRNPRKHRRRRGESRARRRRSKAGAAKAVQILQVAPVQQPLLTTTVSDDAESDMETQTYLDSQTSLLDCQSNNSRRDAFCGASSSFGRWGGVTTSVNNANSVKSPDQSDHFYDIDFRYQESTSESEQEADNSNAATSEDFSNKNAVAKGANALVKQATSRQTEIIDTSKMLEEGKVETHYEEPPDPEIIEPTDYKLIDEYEKTFAYARRLRALLNMQFKVMDRSSLEANFLLVKAHEHPTQKTLERWRNVDMGSPYDGQIRQQKLIDDFKALCASKKKPKKGQVRVERFPDWMKFYIRFRKDRSEQRWLEYLSYRQRVKKASGGKIPAPKVTDKYMPINFDVWSTTVVAYAKPNATLQNLVDPVFAKLGLEARADFKFTVGCFKGDTRTGKASIPGGPSAPDEVTMQVTCTELYKRNCNEIFVNDNRIEMFRAFPTYFRSAVKKPEDAGDKKGDKMGDKKGDKMGDKKGDKKDDKKGDKKGSANQSNLESDCDLAHQSDSAPPACVRSMGGKSSKSDASECGHGDTPAAKLSEAVEEFEDKSSLSAKNQNVSVYDCESSDDFESQPTAYGAYTTTKSGRSETTRRETE